MAKQGVLVRAVTKEECSSLKGDLPKGTIVYECKTGVAVDGQVIVSVNPHDMPFHEVAQDAVAWGNVFIELPIDPARVEQLQRKLQQYRDRLKVQRKDNNNDEYGCADSVCKIAVLSNLLANCRVDLEGVKHGLELSRQSTARLDVAFHVVSDYSITGGQHIYGGTGLPSLDETTVAAV